MRLVKPSATVIAALALWVGAGVGAFAQAKQAPAKQAPAPKSAEAPKAAPAKQQAVPPAKPAAPPKAVAKAPVKAPAKAQAKAPAKAVAKKPASKVAAKPAETKKVVTAAVGKRDPFQPLVSKAEPGKALDEDLGPGPGGVRVSGLRLDGVVRAPSGMIAVITTPRQRVYFIREGTHLYDGVVEKISLDSITLRERGKDPFGKPLDRQVIKRLYPRAGEQ
jgi:Tfp pilus assembly protein PilP